MDAATGFVGGARRAHRCPTRQTARADGDRAGRSDIMSKLALRGRIVTMNAASDVVINGTLYIDGDSVAAVAKDGEAAPAGFEGGTAVDTRRTIFPRLIELHNHLPYNTIGLWQVGQKYGDPDKWRGAAAYNDGPKRPTQGLAA